MISFVVFIVDDDISVRKSLSVILGREYVVKDFESAEEALDACKEVIPDLILLDIGLPGMNGFEALDRIRTEYPDTLVIMITAYEEVETVVSAMKKGAYDYIVKPIHLDTLRATVRKALDTLRMKKEIQSLQQRYLQENLPVFIGASDKVQDTMTLVSRIARSTDAPVLIVGESGTGKEWIAHAIHYKSPLYNRPFVPINCAAVPRELIESELFGYEKGAFTGAAGSGKRGLVEEADGGTLFLDEVGDLSLDAQAKLLRFVESGEYYRVGGTRKLRVKVRIISATNKNLEELIEKGLFREDLYYRLAVIKIAVPSLNERREDILPIAKYFLLEFSRKYGKDFTGMDAETEQFLLNHRWRGNVRELRNMIERGVLIGDGPILRLSDLELAFTGGRRYGGSNRKSKNQYFPPLPDDGLDLNALEEHYLKEAFRRARGNGVQAARLLGMSYYAFRYRMRKLRDRESRGLQT